MKKSLIAIPIILVAVGGILNNQTKKGRHIEAKSKNENQNEDNKGSKNSLRFLDKSDKEKACKKFYKSIKPENKTNIKVLNMPVFKLFVNVQLGFFNNEDKK